MTGDPRSRWGPDLPVMEGQQHPVLAELAAVYGGAPSGMLMLLDYSSYEGTDIPLPAAAAAGVAGIFTRLVMGLAVDPLGGQRLTQMRAQTAVVPGVYAYAHEDNPQGQVDNLAAHLGDGDGVMVMYDWELDPATQQPISVGSATAWVQAFRTRYPGHRLIGYFPHWVSAQLGLPDVGGLFDVLMASNYSTLDWSAYSGMTPQILQFTDQSLYGADASYFRGDLAALQSLAGAATPVPTPVPADEEDYDVQFDVPLSGVKMVVPGWRPKMQLRLASDQADNVRVRVAFKAKGQGPYVCKPADAGQGTDTTSEYVTVEAGGDCVLLPLPDHTEWLSVRRADGETSTSAVGGNLETNIA